ncbi:MAG: endonuclease NucS domain-containing protein [Hyphomicrobiaceae bacterium]|nr:DUF91 domain-containing protein [Hyphomicrobiaceae bacterium]
MTIRHAIWKVGAAPAPLAEATLPKEELLEDMIVAAPSILHDQWMLVGRQCVTGFSGRIDLIAIAPDGSLVLIELKRDRTPRDVVAQAIDYATFVEELKAEDVAAIYSRFAPGRDLGADFESRFGIELEEDMLNASHQIVIVADKIDDSTVRIVNYLNERDIPINVLCFQVFANDSDTFLSRTWLLDPAETQANAAEAPKRDREPWNGEFYASFGEDGSRSWDEAVSFGFISAGGGSWYSNSLRQLKEGDRIWVKIPGRGFVGVARVRGPRVAAADFMLSTPNGERKALDVLSAGHYHRQFSADADRSEYFIPVEWLKAVDRAEAVHELGMFGNQNTISKPTVPKWRTTVERLKQVFGVKD